MRIANLIPVMNKSRVISTKSIANIAKASVNISAAQLTFTRPSKMLAFNVNTNKTVVSSRDCD